MQNLVIFALALLFSLPSYGKIKNFGSIDDNIYRGGKLEGGKSDFEELQSLGVDTIINLDFMHKDNQGFCDEFSMDCQQFPLVLLPWYDHTFDYKRFMEAYGEVIRLQEHSHTIYVHCIHGSDRTGAMASALIIRKRTCNDADYDRNFLKEEVVGELNKYKFKKTMFPKLYQTILQWVESTPAWICASHE